MWNEFMKKNLGVSDSDDVEKIIVFEIWIEMIEIDEWMKKLWWTDDVEFETRWRRKEGRGCWFDVVWWMCCNGVECELRGWFVNDD